MLSKYTLSKYTKILVRVVLFFALAAPSIAKSAPSEDDHSPFVTTSLTPPSILIGESSTVEVNFNNVPVGGFASAEFTCTYNPAVVEISAITPTNLFGGDPITVVNGPQNGSFVFAIAGSVGNMATSDGAAFTFSATGLQLGQSTINCQVRASTGNLVLITIPPAPVPTASIDVIEFVPAPTQGTLVGQVHAGKPVTVTLKDQNGSVAGAVVANPDGTFSLSVPAGTYTAVASAPGFLRAQGTVIITSGGTTTLQLISLLAGDIDGNDVIDHFDALTIGINYNGTVPAAADLSNDGTINVLELEILSPNYRKIGPLDISTGTSPVETQSPLPTTPTNIGIPVDSTATPVVPTVTVAPSTATAMPGGVSIQLWHPPGAHDGLNAHEHGDKPPAWADEWSMANFGHPVGYGGDEATPNENLHKHVAYKGADHTFGVNGCNIDTYFRFHAQSNPHGRTAPFHSYEMYARDCAGGISFWQGWLWVGYPEFRSQRMTKGNEQPGTILTDGSGLPAPGRDQFIISAPDHADWNNFLRSDQWYMFNPFWEVSVTILNSTVYFNYDEHLGDIMNPATWELTGSKGLTRRFEMSHYTSTGAGSPVDGVNVPLNAWYCVQLAPTEDRVEGNTHRPSWDVTGAVASPNSCPNGYVPQYKSSTFPAQGLSFRNGNAYEKTFPGEGIVTVPN